MVRASAHCSQGDALLLQRPNCGLLLGTPRRAVKETSHGEAAASPYRVKNGAWDIWDIPRRNFQFDRQRS